MARSVARGAALRAHRIAAAVAAVGIVTATATATVGVVGVVAVVIGLVVVVVLAWRVEDSGRRRHSEGGARRR